MGTPQMADPVRGCLKPQVALPGVCFRPFTPKFYRVFSVSKRKWASAFLVCSREFLRKESLLCAESYAPIPAVCRTQTSRAWVSELLFLCGVAPWRPIAQRSAFAKLVWRWACLKYLWAIIGDRITICKIWALMVAFLTLLSTRDNCSAFYDTLGGLGQFIGSLARIVLLCLLLA